MVQITNVELLKYDKSLNDKSPLVLLNDDPNSLYLAQSGIINTTLNKNDITFTAAKTHYNLGDKNTLVVILTAKVDGVDLTKTFTFSKNSYDIKLSQTVQNNSADSFTGKFYGQILRKDATTSTSLLDVHSYATFTGATLSSIQDKYQKESYKDIASNAQNIRTTQGWAAMVQHYFLSAWVPENATAGNENTIFTRSLGDGTYTTGVAMPTFTITSGESATDNSQLYIGPTIKTKPRYCCP